MQTIQEYFQALDKLLASSSIEQIGTLNQALMDSAVIDGVNKISALESCLKKVRIQMGSEYTPAVHTFLFPQFPLIELKDKLENGAWQYEYSIEDATGDFVVKALKYVTEKGEVPAYIKPGPERLKRDMFLHNFVRFLQENGWFPSDYNPFVQVQPALVDLNQVCFTEEMCKAKQENKYLKFELIFEVSPSIEAVADIESKPTSKPRLLIGNLQPALDPLVGDESPYHLLLMLALCLVFEMRDVKLDAMFKGYVLADAEDFLAKLDPNKYKDFPKIHLPILEIFQRTAGVEAKAGFAFPEPGIVEWQHLQEVVKSWFENKESIQKYLESQVYQWKLFDNSEIKGLHKSLDHEGELKCTLPGGVIAYLEENGENRKFDFLSEVISAESVERFVTNIGELVIALQSLLKGGKTPEVIDLPRRYCPHWAEHVLLYEYMQQRGDVLQEFYRSNEFHDYISQKKNVNSFVANAALLLRALSDFQPVAMAGDRRTASPTSQLTKFIFLNNPKEFVSTPKRDPSAPKTTPQKRTRSQLASEEPSSPVLGPSTATDNGTPSKKLALGLEKTRLADESAVEPLAIGFGVMIEGEAKFTVGKSSHRSIPRSHSLFGSPPELPAAPSEEDQVLFEPPAGWLEP